MTLRRSKLLLVGTIFLLVVCTPTVTFAMRRNHRYHADRNTKSTKVNSTFTISPTLTGTADVNGQDLLSGQWSYMPGITKTSEGLVIQETDMAIVSQNGTDSVPNPPINLAGTYLKDITGNFSITAQVQIPADTTATIQLYSNPPVIADEFRMEKPSLQFVFSNGQLQVNSLGSSKQTTAKQTFSIPMEENMLITLTRQADSMEILINNISIGTIKVPSLFTSGKLWFGFDSANGEWVLAHLNVQELPGGSVTIADRSVLSITNHNPKGIQALASQKRPGFLVGMALAIGPIVSDPAYNSIAFDNAMFGSITLENDMKMQNLQPKEGVYTFQKADAMLNFAKQNGIKDIHGHTLVFGEANPPWFNALPVKTTADKQHIEKIMLDHITTVVKHFGDKVDSWDVVNEPLADYDDYDANGQVMRNHKWYQAMGNSYIIKAFVAAYKANPKAILSINEYGLEEDGDRWDNFLTLLKQFKTDLATNHIPQENISIGFQAHVYEEGDKIDPEVLRNHIKTLAVLGFKSQISEMDVYGDDGFDIQAEQYADILNTCISEPSCIAWRGWMLTDKYDIFQDDSKVEYGQDGLFDSSLKPRPAISSMQQVLTTTSN